MVYVYDTWGEYYGEFKSIQSAQKFLSFLDPEGSRIFFIDSVDPRKDIDKSAKK